MNKIELYNLIKSNKNKGGYYSKETTIKKKYSEIYDDFFNKMKGYFHKFKFSQLLWHYLNDDYELLLGICPVCGKRSKFINCVIGYQTYCSIKCSRKEAIEKMKQTCLEKYGVSFSLSNREIRKKIENTNIEKYGCKNVFQSKEIKEKSKQTCLEKYGVEHYQSTDEFKELAKENISKNINSIKEKSKQTCLEKYGVEHYQSTDEFKELAKETMKKWNTKLREKCIEKYNGTYQSTDDFKEKIKFKQNQNIISKYKNVIDIIGDDVICKCVCTDCSLCNKKIFSLKKSIFFNRISKNIELCDKKLDKIKKDFGYSTSKEEKEVVDFIKSIYNNTIIENDKTILDGKEIDIYLPERNIGIEFNGLYWHNELNKDKNYHFDKYIRCNKKGIQLIQIWEDDWLYKKDIIKSLIKTKLNLNDIRVAARKCEVKEIKSNECSNFLNKYHIQGNVNSSVKIGLFYNNELISVSTFGKLRKIVNSSTKNNEFELYRFCTKENYTIIGGFSKMLSFFIKKYNPSEIITYSSMDISNGDVYSKCNFEFIGYTKPGYYWVIKNKKQHRFNFTKQKLIKMGYDKNKTEVEIMHELGYYRIYDSGNKKFKMIL